MIPALAPGDARSAVRHELDQVGQRGFLILIGSEVLDRERNAEMGLARQKDLQQPHRVQRESTRSQRDVAGQFP